MADAPLIELKTERTRLRGWRPEDADPYAALNADPRVMEFFESTFDRAKSEESRARMLAGFAERGWGFWVLEIPSVTEFAGVVGISVPKYTAPFTPCVEVGWRLFERFWGKGYATEAAREALRFGFEDLKLEEIVAMTTPDNVRSRAVMHRLGMTYDPGADFDHPMVPAGHKRQRHVLYRLKRGDFRK